MLCHLYFPDTNSSVIITLNSQLSTFNYLSFAGAMNIEAHILTASTRSMNTSELMAPISMYSCTSIFTPMNTSNTLTPTFR